ncbi:hypothetical protein EW146_g1041 [Bondarzewia mesenterica]|uniref:DUF6741 domain-containing protein n=1 Tax=Bondarzewia mesenterica TaxID=1095465 RepID=A0A4S4M4Z7_9AGAM|nr:hypothetical protein EW146_g1041 [Bondarzewia mesenterica]
MAYYEDWPRAAATSRRPSFSSTGQVGFGFDNQYHTAGQFNDPYANGGGYQEVRGAPIRPATAGPRLDVPPFNSSQPFPQQHYPPFPPGQIHQQYSTREQHPPSPNPPLLSQQPKSILKNRGPSLSRPAFDDSPQSDDYYPLDERPRTRSTGAYVPPPSSVLTAPAPAMTPFPSQYSKRPRRSSTSSLYAPMPMQMPMQAPMVQVDGYRRVGGMHVKFKVKNSYRSGVSLSEAMGNVRLSSSHEYTFHDLKTDHRGRLMLKVRWNGFRSLMYEIPVSGQNHDHGRYINMQSFSRRIARAIVHFLAANAIHIPWDRVILHHLEETGYVSQFEIATKPKSKKKKKRRMAKDAEPTPDPSSSSSVLPPLQHGPPEQSSQSTDIQILFQELALNEFIELKNQVIKLSKSLDYSMSSNLKSSDFDPPCLNKDQLMNRISAGRCWTCWLNKEDRELLDRETPKMVYGTGTIRDKGNAAAHEGYTTRRQPGGLEYKDAAGMQRESIHKIYKYMYSLVLAKGRRGRHTEHTETQEDSFGTFVMLTSSPQRGNSAFGQDPRQPTKMGDRFQESRKAVIDGRAGQGSALLVSSSQASHAGGVNSAPQSGSRLSSRPPSAAAGRSVNFATEQDLDVHLEQHRLEAEWPQQDEFNQHSDGEGQQSDADEQHRELDQDEQDPLLFALEQDPLPDDLEEHLDVGSTAEMARRAVSDAPPPIYRRPPPQLDLDEDDDDDEQLSHIADVRLSQEFIRALRDARHKDSGLDEAAIERLRNPSTDPLTLDDPDLRLSLDTFFAVSNGSEKIYELVHHGILRHYPDSGMLTHAQIKRCIAEISGIVPILNDMCPNSCHAYTGPYADRETCAFCSEPRYDPLVLAQSRGRKKVPRLEYRTIPIGPFLQAQKASEQSAQDLLYRKEVTEKIMREWHTQDGLTEFRDIFWGTDYLDNVENGNITPDDMCLMFSIDGAQLYEKKMSDCWIYIWILLDRRPDQHYKKRHTLPGGFIPGPNHPKNLDSFIFLGLYHLAAIQNEGGFVIWDALLKMTHQCNPWVLFVTADTPALADIDGQPRYYYAAQCPHNYDIAGCNHDDWIYFEHSSPSTAENAERYCQNLAKVISSRTQTAFVENHKATACFPIDLMHLIALNLPDILLRLWRSEIVCATTDSKANWRFAVLVDNVWKAHGKAVRDAVSYLPGSFDRPPRNPADKINSGYKAWEYLTWIFGYSPTLLHNVLPDVFYRNYCQLACGVRVIYQHGYTLAELQVAYQLLTTFCDDFETIYCEHWADRIHFVTHTIHIWPMERAIGDLTAQIRQPSKPYANLSIQGVRCAQVNALAAMAPDLNSHGGRSTLPRGSIDLGGEYVLLKARDNCARKVRDCEAEAIRSYLAEVGEENVSVTKVTRWARLRLPTGQNARSEWREMKDLTQLRMSCNVKVQLAERSQIAEVLYYFILIVDGIKKAVAMVSLYSDPNPDLLKQSYGTYWSSKHQGDTALRVIDYHTIKSVVAMVPIADRYFLVKKLGLEIVRLGGSEEDMDMDMDIDSD